MPSRSAILALVLWACALGGCEGCSGDGARAAADPGSSTSAAASAGSERADPEAEQAEPGPPPQVRVRADTDRYDHLTVAVENRGDEPARLASVLAVQRKDGDGFAPEEGKQLVLGPDCSPAHEGQEGHEAHDGEDDGPDCVTLVPGAVLFPCECGGCDDLGAGERRFVAHSCDGAHALESPPVALER